MRGRCVSTLVMVCLSAAVVPSEASNVVVWGERFDLTRINHFYNTVAGTTSTIANGTLDTVNLSGVELLWAVQPADAYTAAELAAMAGFLSGGGRIAFMGEHGGFAPDENDRISAALSFLGADISIVNEAPDAGSRTASVLDGQIKPHELTQGVNTYYYACFAPLLVSGTAQVLMTGEEHPDQVMMAYQNIGPGSVFLITDQNVWDDEPGNWGNGLYDNRRMFENLLLADTGAPPPPPPADQVPEPSAVLLLAAGLMGMATLRRRL